jgi:hypothetical protein
MALAEKSGERCLEILVAADELLMNELHDLMQDHLLNHHRLWLHQSFALVYRTSVKLEASKELQDFCQNILNSEPDVLLMADDFITIDQDTLEYVLEQRNFQMREISIWNHIIKWCISKHPNFSNDITKWTSQDFNKFEETLRQWIPFIRFCEINSSEFYQMVRPFRSCLPDSLYEDLECFYYTGVQKESLTYLPNNAIRSCLVIQEQISIIANWIDGGGQIIRNNNYNNNNNSNNNNNNNNLKYHFGLLLRGSIDGFSAEEFHKKCDNKGPTLVIMRISGTDHIVGGYNPTSWQSQSGWVTTRDSFIFSLGYGSNSQSQLSRILQPEKAIWNSATYGPCFGDGDLWCVENLFRDEQCSSNPKSYRQGICDAIIKSLTGEPSSLTNDEKRWSSTTFGLGASFSSTNSSPTYSSSNNNNNNNDVWGNDWNFTNNATTSSPTTTNFEDNIKFNVDEYEVFRVSRTDTYKSINQRKFRRGKKRLTLVEKYHTAVSDSD